MAGPGIQQLARGVAREELLGLADIPMEAIVRRFGELSEQQLTERVEQSDRFPEREWLFVSSTAVRKIKFEPSYSILMNAANRISMIRTARANEASFLNQRGNLWVVFLSGPKEYKYPNVPRGIYRKFSMSGSKGQYVHYVLRPLYSVGRGRRL